MTPSNPIEPCSNKCGRVINLQNSADRKAKKCKYCRYMETKHGTGFSGKNRVHIVKGKRVR